MSMIGSVSKTALLVAVTLVAFALSGRAAAEMDLSGCAYPDPPPVPDGEVATEAEMGEAGTAVREYVAAVQEALQCLGELEAERGDGITSEEQATLIERYNQGVDQMNATAQEYNTQVGVFRER